MTEPFENVSSVYCNSDLDLPHLENHLGLDTRSFDLIVIVIVFASMLLAFYSSIKCIANLAEKILHSNYRFLV